MAKIPEEDKAQPLWGSSGDILVLADDRLELYGGGDFCDEGYPQTLSTEPDEATWAKARELAAKYDKRITSAHGEWQGWSCYTGDPGDVSVFTWEDN